MCEECESLHDRSGRPDTVMGQSIVLSEIKTEVPLENDDPAYQNFVLQQHEERIERLSQPDKVNSLWMQDLYVLLKRFNSGESKKIFRVNSHRFQIGLTIDGKHAWQEEEQKRRYQHYTDDSGIIVYHRALQGHSGRNLIDPSLQDNVVIQSGFFQHIYHIGSAFNLH